MKNTLLKWATLFIVLFFSSVIFAAEFQIYSTNFSTLEPLTNPNSSPAVVSSDGKYEIIKGTIATSGAAPAWAPSNGSNFLTSSSQGAITFNNLPLYNGGRIEIKWGSASGRPLNVTSGATTIGTHASLASGERSTIISENFTIPASLTGNTSITIASSGGGGVYIFEVNVYTNTQGPIIDNFVLAGVAGNINTTTGAIAVTVPFSTNLSSLTPTFVLSGGTSFVVPADATAAKDFSVPVSYNMTDGTDTKIYTVTVTKTPASTACNILTYSITGQIGASQFIAASGPAKDSIIVTMPYSTTALQLQSLVPSYTTSPLVLSSVPNTGIAQDFTAPISYLVTAEDGTSTKEYIVRVKKAPASTACFISNFALGIPNEQVTINQSSSTILITVGASAVLTGLTPATLVNSPLSTITSPVFPQDFSTPVSITVLAEDGVTSKTYIVTTTKDVSNPSITATNPVDASSEVSLAGQITLTFDEDVVIGTGGVTLSGGTISATPTSINGSTVKYTFSGLTSLLPYTITIPAGAFNDIYGNPSNAKTINFTTADGVNQILPYASHMEGASFSRPAFISGGTYVDSADVKATTSTQYGAYKLAPGEKLTITTSKVDSVCIAFYAPGENRNFSITNNKTLDVTTGNFTNYDNNGMQLIQKISNNGLTEIYVNNDITSSGDIYISYIYISDMNAPALTEREQWCK